MDVKSTYVTSKDATKRMEKPPIYVPTYGMSTKVNGEEEAVIKYKLCKKNIGRVVYVIYLCLSSECSFITCWFNC